MSRLVCTEEHQNCFRYEGGNSPSVEILHRIKGTRWEGNLIFSEIVIVCGGSILLSYDYFLNHRVGSGKMLLLPPGCHFMAIAEEETSLFIFRLKEALPLCESFSISHLLSYKKNEIVTNQLNTLTVNEFIDSFLWPLRSNIENGLRCANFFKQKIEELMILLRVYYTKEELVVFFDPILSNTSEFTNFVLQNYRKTKTVGELAELYSCSISCFDKKFRKAFGMAPYRWMQERKVNLIYHEINATNKPIKQIAEEQRFTSLPQFNDYCKKHFGNPPGKMRKQVTPSMKMKA